MVATGGVRAGGVPDAGEWDEDAGSETGSDPRACRREGEPRKEGAVGERAERVSREGEDTHAADDEERDLSRPSRWSTEASDGRCCCCPCLRSSLMDLA